jgi:hypothetical protein
MANLEFAMDNVQIQGQLRTREYVQDEAKKTATEIRGTSIVKLERSHSQQTTVPSERKEVAY